jgi:hypothetical protein
MIGINRGVGDRSYLVLEGYGVLDVLVARRQAGNREGNLGVRSFELVSDHVVVHTRCAIDERLVGFSGVFLLDFVFFRERQVVVPEFQYGFPVLVLHHAVALHRKKLGEHPKAGLLSEFLRQPAGLDNLCQPLALVLVVSLPTLRLAFLFDVSREINSHRRTLEQKQRTLH